MAPATQTTISSFFGRMKENATATLSVALGKRKREPFQEIENSRDIESAGWNTPPTRRIFDHVLIIQKSSNAQSVTTPTSPTQRFLELSNTAPLTVRTNGRAGRNPQISYDLWSPSSSEEPTEDRISDFEDMKSNEADFSVESISDAAVSFEATNEMDIEDHSTSDTSEIERHLEDEIEDDDIPSAKRRKIYSDMNQRSNKLATKTKVAPKQGPKPKAQPGSKGSSQTSRNLQLNYPPLSGIREIFLDITKKALTKGFEKVIDRLEGSTLRIATMCSGTESPLLALRLINQSLEQLGKQAIFIEHVFSAEIEPFKQSYIERNFRPPLLFRDITEFVLDDTKQMKGITAYGAEELVPGNVDILVAGSSCVDFSVLNMNQAKSFDECEGESVDTFLAVIRYTKWARPPIVILENVIKEEAWEGFETHFDKIGYATKVIKVDTKVYYIPHTRQRKYMLCLDQNLYGKTATRILEKWAEFMEAFQRRASAPVTSFLLPADDPRRISLLAKDGTVLRESWEANRGWEACRGRHLLVRSDENLGPKKPVTTVLPEHADKRWLSRRVPRELDVIDICHLQRAKGGIDSSFKTRVIDLSQNIERVDHAPLGISSCLTPSGTPYLTDQCGPVTGLDALKLQGLPIEELSFTSETDGDLKDLAGNAMSSTIVGPAILSALFVAVEKLAVTKEGTMSEWPLPASKLIPQLSGENQLQRIDLKPVTSLGLDWSQLLQDAAKSSRQCFCEAQTQLSNHNIRICDSCGHTACERCLGNPKHNFGDAVIRRTNRLMPHEFISKWTCRFPLQLRLDCPVYELISQKDVIDKDIRDAYLQTIEVALKSVMCFGRMIRTETWRVVYESPLARLEISLARDPELSLFISPPTALPANSKLRQVFGLPVARSALNCCTSDLNSKLDIQWWIPSAEETKYSISGIGQKMSSWRARLGLPDFANEAVYQSLNVCSAQDVTNSKPRESLSGRYDLLENCGTACASLYRRISSESTLEDDVYLFLDPDPIGDPVNDKFVFSKNHRRLSPGDAREILTALQPDWRPWEVKKSNVRAYKPGFWTTKEEARIEIVAAKIEYRSADPIALLDTVSRTKDCTKVTAILAAHAIVPKNLKPKWTVHQEVKDDKIFYDHFSWVFRDAQNLTNLKEWIPVENCESLDHCETCSPDPPTIRWRQDSSGKLAMQENHLEAALYERKLKTRPASFYIKCQIDQGSKSNIAHIAIGLNVRSLAHRAVAKLGQGAPVVADWRVDTGHVECTIPKFRRFSIQSNKNDNPHSQPLGMRHSLRPEQLRSLGWMKAQERGSRFRTQEVEEALLPRLGWRAEVRASTEVMVKGGVLADQPSYGKTITSLALIHDEFSRKSNTEQVLEHSKGPTGNLISSAATLIVTPSHLIRQWREEVQKFLPSSYNANGQVVVIASFSDLTKRSIQDFLNAKIVIVSWKVLLHEAYVSQLALFTALPEPNVSGREFKVWLEYALRQIPSAVKKLKTANNIKAFADEMNQDFERNRKSPAFQASIPSKRLKGQKYVAAKAKKKALSNADVVQVFEKPKGELASVRSNKHDGWKWLARPLFHIFQWNRLVIDEFALLMESMSRSQRTPSYASVARLQADKRWILSGTPPLDDFTDVKAIAGLLGINLGEDAFCPGIISKEKLRDLRGELSSSELFRSFQELKSFQWHMERHAHAQTFLDVFMRQNDADISHIDCRTSFNPVRLNTAHRAVYAEMENYLRSVYMKTREPAHRGSDREQRMNDNLKDTKSSEDALLRSCATFSSDSTSDSCDHLVNLRAGQLHSLKDDIQELLRLAEFIKKRWRPSDEKYAGWQQEPVEDPDARHVLKGLILDAKQQPANDTEARGSLIKFFAKGKKQTEKMKINSSADAVNKLKDVVLELRPLTRELTSRVRSLRYVQAIRRLQGASKPPRKQKAFCDGTDCHDAEYTISDLRLLSVCGHCVCPSCLEQCTAGACIVEGCAAEPDLYSIKLVDEFIASDDISVPTTRSFGAKLDKIVTIINATPKEEQAIIFAQDDSLVEDVSTCLDHHDIKCLAVLKESKDGDILEDIEDFKVNTDLKTRKKVLVLNLRGHYATGLNLTNANHIFFLSPLHALDQYNYDSKMLQAIRRAHRFGQERSVRVYRFAGLKTVDVDILENRERLLTEPLWEHPETLGEDQSRRGNGTEMQPGMAKVIKIDGCFALAPRSWLKKCGITDEQDHSTQVRLSSAYEGLDDHDVNEG